MTEIERGFLESGWVQLDLLDTTDVLAVRDALLERLREKWIPDLGSLDDYHHFIEDDALHTTIQHDLTEMFWHSGAARRIVTANRSLFLTLLGPDLHIQKYPYLRIARPAKQQDNLGLHRDTFYGSSAYEVSFHIPFVDLDASNALGLLPGSHVVPESAFAWRQVEEPTVAKGSKKHELGFLYAPKVMESGIDVLVEPVPTRVGQALLFNVSIVHGQTVNRSPRTRFSCDIRLVNSLAPIQWERTVHRDYYARLSSSVVSEQARRYEAANAVVEDAAGTERFHCKICGGGPLSLVPEFWSLPRVTSDCIPFRSGSSLSICTACNGIQKLPDEAWLRDTAEIYRDYAAYRQSGGVEQAVFGGSDGRPELRSTVLVKHLAERLALSSTGRMLDVGCGSGAMLSAFSEVRPGWALYGLDLDDRSRPLLERIRGFSGLHTGDLAAIDDRFDLVTLSHSLEHMPEPEATLAALRQKLVPGGRIFLQVPDAQQNPFDLVVADHLCHFSPATLARLVERAGFRIESGPVAWVGKEISLVARAEGTAAGRLDGEEERLLLIDLRARAAWLRSVIGEARRAAEGSRIALFGTSISATWLFGQLRDRVSFFVDEDPGRTGGLHMERPIFRPAEAPAGTTVFLALLPAVARHVHDRLKDLPLHFVLPPEIPVARE